MKTNNNIPAYRFQGYTDAWELRKSKDILKTHSFRSYLAGVSENGEYEVIQQGDKPIVGYSDGEPFTDYKDVTLFGDHTVSLYKPKSPFFVATDGVKILSADNFEGDYLYTTLERYKPEPQGYKRHFTILKNQDVCFTENMEEQQKIGVFFKQLDATITLHQRKLDTLKEQKKTYLKLLFPVKGQTKPALRFQGFEDDWEEVKLGELCDIRTGKLDANAMVENGKYDFYTSGIKKYKIDVAEFEGPAITIAGNGATVGYMHLADGKFNAYQRTYVLTNFKVDRSYIFSEVAEKLPMKIQQEARTGNIPYIVLSMLTELSISLPSLPEQEAIGTFFQTLDQEIAQVEDKLASLKEMKKTLLRKLFV